MVEADIAELRRVLVFTCKGETDSISVRHLECKDITEAAANKDAVAFREIGPSFNMRLRREKMATPELFKDACRKPKIANMEKKKANKNKYTNILGETKAKVFMQPQDLDTIATRKFRIGKNAQYKNLDGEEKVDKKPKVSEKVDKRPTVSEKEMTKRGNRKLAAVDV